MYRINIVFPYIFVRFSFAGNVRVTQVPNPSSEVRRMSRSRKPDSFLHRYSPMPVAPGAAVGAGKAPVEHPGQLMSRDADPVILNGELYLFSERLCGNGYHRVFSPVTGGVLEELSENKNSPLFVRADLMFQVLSLDPDTALEE